MMRYGAPDVGGGGVCLESVCVRISEEFLLVRFSLV